MWNRAGAYTVGGGAALRAIGRGEGLPGPGPERYPALEAAIRAGHPYELPEIIALPAGRGLPAYLEWVDGETHP